MEPIVTAAECAIAVALPLTFAELAADLEAPGHDFARSMIEGSGRDLREAWDEIYEPQVVRACDQLEMAARSVGATVVLGATLRDVAHLAAIFPVVGLVAHSVQTPITAMDIIEPEGILAVIDAGESIVARQLRRRLEAGPRSLHDSERVAAFLDDALVETRDWMSVPARRERRERPSPHLERVLLERCFGFALRPAPLLELRDGLVTLTALEAAIPSDFGGVLDLAVCNSIAIGELLKRERRECLIVRHEFLARIDLQLARFAIILEVLAKRPARYSDVLHQLSLSLVRGKA